MTRPQQPPPPGWHQPPPPGWHQPPPPRSTDGFAIASLVLGVIGGFVLAIVFGFVAKSRIKASGGRKDGDGLATAGIALGFVWLALIAIFVVLGVTGVFDDENADKFSGKEAEVAVVADRFEQWVEDDPERVCDELLTPAFADAVAEGNGKSCPDSFRDALDGARQLPIEVHSVDITGDTARMELDEGDDRQTWTVLERDGTWLIDAID